MGHIGCTDDKVRCTYDWSHCNVQSWGAVDQEVSIEDRGAVGKTIVGLVAVEVDELSIVWSCHHLWEGDEVEDVLALRDEIVEGEVWSSHCVVVHGEIILGSRYWNDVVHIKERSVVVNRVIICLWIEEDVVENDICGKDNCPVLWHGPPWWVAEEGLLILLEILNEVWLAVVQRDGWS